MISGGSISAHSISSNKNKFYIPPVDPDPPVAHIDALLVPPARKVLFEGSIRLVAFDGNKRVVSFEGSIRKVVF